MGIIIAIVGKAGHGKDTLADLIIEKYSQKHTELKGNRLERSENFRPFEKRRFAEGVKATCAAITGYPVSVFHDRARYSDTIKSLNRMTLRELMQKVGQGLRTEVSNDIWVSSALNRVKYNDNVIFVDTRYPNEIEGVRSVGGKIIHVVRPNYIDPTLENEESKNHISETALNGYDIKPDEYILNTSLEALEEYTNNYLIDKILEWENNSNSDRQYPKEETP